MFSPTRLAWMLVKRSEVNSVVENEIYASLSVSDKQVAFQYSPTPGHPALLKSLKVYLRGKGLPLEGNGPLITHTAHLF